MPCTATIISRLKPTRRWLQFSLRTMLLLMCAVGVWLGWFVDRAQRQKWAVEAIEAAGGNVGFRHQSLLVDPCEGMRSRGPAWLLRLIGEQYFVQAINVRLPSNRSPDSQTAAYLSDLPYLEGLRIDGLQSSDQLHARSLTTLKDLVIKTSTVVDLNCFVSNRELESIALSLSGASEIDLRPLDAFPKLLSVRLELKSESNVGNIVKQVSRLRQLEELSLESSNLTGDDLAPLSALENLRYLRLRGLDFKDSTLVLLQELPRLVIADIRVLGSASSPLPLIGLFP